MLLAWLENDVIAVLVTLKVDLFIFVRIFIAAFQIDLLLDLCLLFAGTFLRCCGLLILSLSRNSSFFFFCSLDLLRRDLLVLEVGKSLTQAGNLALELRDSF